MTWSEITVLVIVTLLLVLWWVWLTANRLDRLHRKVAASRAALDTQLVRRASAAAELASSGVLDPVSSVLVADAAWSALSAGGHGDADMIVVLPDLARATAASAGGTVATSAAAAGEEDLCAGLRGSDGRAFAESELSRTLRAALEDPDDVAELGRDPLGAELLEALVAAWYRVQLARRFHNDAVTQARRVRRTVLVRVLRLHGHAAMPRTVEIDDGWPDGLPRPGHVG